MATVDLLDFSAGEPDFSFAQGRDGNPAAIRLHAQFQQRHDPALAQRGRARFPVRVKGEVDRDRQLGPRSISAIFSQ